MKKGIVIELTALLDVILIMMFWLMMSLQNENDTIRTDYEEQIAQAEQDLNTANQNLKDTEKRANDAIANMQSELQKIREDADKEIVEAWKKAASINDNATANQLALDKYEQGILITINLKYDTDTKLIISDKNNILEQSNINVNDISEKLISSFEKSESEQDSVILCAFVYDGSEALYKDVKTVRTAISNVKEIYSDMYCTYINTKER